MGKGKNIFLRSQKLALSLFCFFISGHVCLFFFQLLLQECVGKESENLAALTKTTVDFSQTPLGKIVRALESGLSYQFHSSWDLVLHLLGVGLEVCIVHCSLI